MRNLLPPSRFEILSALVFALLVLPFAALARDPVGPSTCKACHPEAYAVWKRSPHARAAHDLAHGSEASCASCHAPQAADKIEGVSCEACHGDGQHYAPSYVMRDAELARAVGLVIPDEAACKRCHDGSSPSLRPFDFATKVELLTHGAADRAARGATAKPKAAPEKKTSSKATKANSSKRR